MTPSPFERSLSPREYSALMDAAKQRAIEARREAIDAFWDAAFARLASAWHAVARAVHVAHASRRAKEPACRP